MTDLTLTIGDKNLSSWSLRPWLLMKYAGIPFKEENTGLDRPDSKKNLNEKSPSGLVPCLTHHHNGRDVKVWDSLAIMEYVAELFPEKRLWPEDDEARAIARSVTAEMHSGFSALRTVWPMAFTRTGLSHLTTGGVQRDIDRINALWTWCRKEYGQNADSGGEFLFGSFSIADAVYAPVVSRFVTYGPVDLSPEATTYRDMIFALPAMKEWGEGARSEISG